MAEEPLGITEITVGGYKSIRDEIPIEIRPLTILAGANSSGKSSIMQPLLMMKQTLDATYDPGSLLINGPNVKFSKYEQMKPHSQKGIDQAFVVGFKFLPKEFDFGKELQLQNEYAIETSAAGKKTYFMERMTSNYPNDNFVISQNMSNDEILRQIPDAYLKPAEGLISKDDDNSRIEWEVYLARCLLYVRLIAYHTIAGRLYRQEHQTPPFNPSLFLEPLIACVIYVPGLRGNPLRTYPVASVQGQRFPGRFQDYAASLALHWKEEADNKIQAVAGNLASLGLTGRIEPVRVDDANVEIQVGRVPVKAEANPGDDLVSIADVGIGVSQVLPVIVALIAAEPGQMVYIEQPELHLHPRAQVALANVLADAVKKRVRVVIETHSSLLLQAVMTLIAQNELDHEDVMLHWFSRDEEGYTIVDRVEFDKNGVSETGWPVDFADIRLTEQRRYLDAVAKRRMGLVNDPV